jgi:hypothetical protein
MSEESGFAPPPFNASNALVGLKRQLRDFKLIERDGGTHYELAGKRIVEIMGSDATLITARLVKKPQLSPEWLTHLLKSSADVRKFQDTVKQQLRRWSADD